FGESHPGYAYSLHELAWLYQVMGRHAEALAMYLRARDLRKQTLGESHPIYAQSLHNLTLLYADAGKADVAAQVSRQSLTITQAHVDAPPAALPDRERRELLDPLSARLDAFLSYAPPEVTAEQLYARCLGFKGLLASRAAEERLFHDRPPLTPL